MRWLTFLRSSLAAFRSARFVEPVQWDEETGIYLNTSVYRGFPLGSIGTGGLNLDTAGGFTETRFQHNWMHPNRQTRGCFWAVSCQRGERRQSRILRQQCKDGSEYRSLPPVQRVSFWGQIPYFRQMFSDNTWPMTTLVEGFSPLIPHNLKDSTLPLAWFEVSLHNRGDAPLQASFLFSFENGLGLGGTGQTGVHLWKGLPVRLHGSLQYNDQHGHIQRWLTIDTWQGIEFTTSQHWPENSHRRNVQGRYLLLTQTQNHSLSSALQWDAADHAPHILEFFAKTGRLPEVWQDQCPPPLDSLHSPHHHQNPRRPASALCVTASLEPKQTQTIPFLLAWWTPDHVVEKRVVSRHHSGEHAGVNVGQYVENHFSSAEEMVRYVTQEQPRLHKQSLELHEIIHQSSLPSWLQHALLNTLDSLLCNSVVPKDGHLYTLEGMDWQWYFGGLCGTNDQRLSAQPFTANLFTALDYTEVDTFRRLHQHGSVPHGNGNCDLALGDSDVPYGLPLEMTGALAAKQWPDLTISCILQIYRHYKTTGNIEHLRSIWPDILAMLEHLKQCSQHGVPEGGSTFDTSVFPGTFIYTATLMLTTLDACCDMAEQIDPSQLESLHSWRNQVSTHIDANLWRDQLGYYASTPNKPTLFLGAMAGEWFARYAGLPSVLPTDRIRSHLRLQHKWLIQGNDHLFAPAAFPFLEVTPDGKPIPTKVMKFFQIYGYAWQVISYHALTAITVGLVEEGLETIQILFQRMWKRGWPWSADLYGNAGPVYMTHPVLWGLLYALTGAAQDIHRATLSLSPRLLPGSSHFSVPVFFPQYWATIHYHSADSLLQIQVHKHFDPPLTLKQITVNNEQNVPVAHVSGSWIMTSGTHIKIPLQTNPQGA